MAVFPTAVKVRCYCNQLLLRDGEYTVVIAKHDCFASVDRWAPPEPEAASDVRIFVGSLAFRREELRRAADTGVEMPQWENPAG
jgi:hypothetical protein